MEFITPLSIVAIALIIGALLVSYAKKIMMTYALIITNFILFIITFVNQEVIYDLGFRPMYLSFEFLPQLYTLITSMFLHGDFFHILGNTIVFLFMGIAFEQRVGRNRFLLIYLITGVCGALAHSAVNLNSSTILIGASGAVFGILGAFAYSYPRDEVVMPIPLGIIMVFRRIKVIYAAILFAVLETIFIYLGGRENTAHLAHIGGLLAGIIIAAIIIGNRGSKVKPSITTIHYDPSFEQKSKPYDFASLRKLATTPALKEELAKIEQETVPQVRDMWLEHFMEQMQCPACGKQLNHFNRKVWCEDNHFQMNY